MRKILLFVLFVNLGWLQAQTITSTYTSGDIPTSFNVFDPACNGPLTVLDVELPVGGPWEVTGIDIEYDMTAFLSGDAWMSEQRSQIHFQNNAISEPVASGVGNSAGVMTYNRPGVGIANGYYPGATVLLFEMRAWRTYDGDFPGCSTGVSQVDDGTWSITVNYQLAPTCFAPSGLMITGLTLTSADIAWTAGASETSWNVEWGAPGFTPGTATELGSDVTATESTTITGLVVNNSYDVYVQADCGAGDLSSWVGPLTIDLLEGNNCDLGLDLATLTSPYSGTTTGFDDNFNIACATNTASDMLFFIEVPANFELVIGQTVNSYDSKNYIGYGSTCPGENQIACFDDPDVQNVTWLNNTGSTQTVYWVQDGFNTGNGAFTLAWQLNFVCPQPTNLDATNITINSVDLTWDENGGTLWNIEYGPTGFTPGTGTTVTGTTDNPYSLTGLDEDTDYDFYVQTDCGLGDESAWAGPFTFTTLASCPVVANIVINNLTATSFDISWTAGGTETDWILEYGEAGFTLGTGTVELVAGTPAFSMIGLDPETEYEFYITADCGGGEESLVVGPTSVTTPPTCPAPTALIISDIEFDEATLSWTSNGVETDWNVEYGPTGFTPGTGTLISVSTFPITITGLDQVTTYDVYVQADCGLGDESAWAGPTTFTTECGVFNTFPFLETFETSSTSITCWSQEYVSGSSNWTFQTGSSGGAITTAYDGTRNARFVSVSGTNNPITKLISPIFDFSGISAAELSFFYGQQEWFGDQNELKVYYRLSDLDPWIELAHYTDNIASWTEVTMLLTDLSATYQLAFEGINNWGRANVVDNVMIITCPAPTDLTVSNLTTTSGDLGWTPIGDATMWNIEYGPTGFTPGDGTTITGTTDNPYSLTGLDVDTDYDFYVQADCGGEESAWAGPFTFTTLANCPIVTDIVVDNLTATSFDISWTAGGTETDWILEYGEAGFTIGDGTIENIAGTTEFSIIGLDPETGYEFYITADCGATQSVTVGPISVTTPPTCPAPTAVNIVDLQSDEATISWTSNGSETMWNVEYGPAGFTPGTGTVLNVPSFPVTISGLDPITEYDVYVQADCGAGDESTWTSVQSFTTPGSCGNFTLSLTDSWGDGWNGGFLDVYVNGVLSMGGLTLPSGTGPLVVDLPMNIGDILSIVYTANGWPEENMYTVTNELGTIVATQGAADAIPGNVGDPMIPSGIEACPTCPAPSAVIISNISQESADVTWTPNGVETEWAIEYGPTGFAFGTGTLIENIISIPHTLTGLDNSTTYDVYVWAVCDVADISGLTGPTSFTTNYGCGGTMYDNGGPTGDYSSNSNDVYILCADNPGDYVQVTFTAFQTETNWDGIYVFDGDDMTAPMIASANGVGFGPMTQPGAYWGSTIPGPFVSTNPEGCLTINFLSDGSVQQAGFEAIIECFPCTPNAGVNGAVDVCRLDGTLDLSTVVTEGEDFGVWTFEPNPSLVSGSVLNIAALPSGTYIAEYIVTTACDADTTIATINVYGPSTAGNSGFVQTCNYGPLNLFDGLSGTVDLGGTWYDPAGNPITGTMVNFNGQIPANYNYYYITSNNVCPADTAFVEVQLMNCASITENELSGFALYPNPTSDVINVQYSGVSMTANMVLVDTKGSVIYNEKVNFASEDNYEIDLSKLVKGVYFLNIYGEEGSKVIKVVRN